ncbi:MAG: type II secretion system protein GspM [Firmicutes bacterium]|nr:type II secretion system protein GspM [Bacillota bacterium]
MAKPQAQPQNSSQQKTLILGIIAAVLIVYFGLFLMPSIDNINKTKSKIAANKKNRAQLRELLEKRPAVVQQEVKPFDGSISAFVEKTAQELNIKISNIRPYGKNSEGVEIKIDDMTGKDLLDFINRMESNGISVTMLDARDYKGSGLWAIKINLEKV